MGEFFFCFPMPLFFEGFMEFKKGGGLIIFSKRVLGVEPGTARRQDPSS
jgi:hypothetical protein